MQSRIRVSSGLDLNLYCATPACDPLEPRRFLSTTSANALFWDRLKTQTASTAELTAHGLTAVDVNGNTVYAKAGEWIAKLNLGTNLASAEAAVGRLGFGAKLKKTLGRSNLALIELPRKVGYAQLRSRFERLALGAYIEPNGIVLPTTTEPNDPLCDEQWGLAKIAAPEAWDSTTGDTNVVMAIFDQGVDYNHEDLEANMWTNPGEIDGDDIDNDGNGYVDDYYGYDFGGNDGDPEPEDHGTQVAGVLGAKAQMDPLPGTGIAGVNWTADIMAIKIYGGSSFFADIAEGLHYVVDMKARGVNVRVTNHSYATPTFSQVLKDAIGLCQQHDILVVAAAGNNTNNNDTTPNPVRPADCSGAEL